MPPASLLPTRGSMIRTQQDYNMTKSRADRLRAAIQRAVHSGPARGEDPRLHAANIEVMRRELEEVETQLREYVPQSPVVRPRTGSQLPLPLRSSRTAAAVGA